MVALAHAFVAAIQRAALLVRNNCATENWKHQRWVGHGVTGHLGGQVQMACKENS